LLLLGDVNEPFVSVPIVIGKIRPATATADPLLLPEGSNQGT